MDRETFALEMSRLKSVYGERYYPAERIAMMFEQLCNTNPMHLQKTISRVICEHMNPPTLTKIKETLALVRQEYQIEDPLEKTRTALGEGKFNNCPRCYGMGLIQIRKKSEGLRYSYLRTCTCGAGAEASRLPENRNKIFAWDGNTDIVGHFERGFDDSVFEVSKKTEGDQRQRGDNA